MGHAEGVLQGTLGKEGKDIGIGGKRGTRQNQHGGKGADLEARVEVGWSGLIGG